MKTTIKKDAFKFVCVVTLLVLMCSGCKKKESDESTPSSPGTNEVWMQNMVFKPATITVAANTIIKWINKDNVVHNAVSNTATVFNSGTMNNGATFSHKFTTAGTFNYTCTFHSGMNGTVIVQ